MIPDETVCLSEEKTVLLWSGQRPDAALRWRLPQSSKHDGNSVYWKL